MEDRGQQYLDAIMKAINSMPSETGDMNAALSALTSLQAYMIAGVPAGEVRDSLISAVLDRLHESIGMFDDTEAAKVRVIIEGTH